MLEVKLKGCIGVGKCHTRKQFNPTERSGCLMPSDPKSKEKVLLVRMDKIGDLVLSLGVDQHPELAEKDVYWMVPKELSAILECSSPQRKYFTWAKEFTWSNFRRALSYLKQQSFDQVVFFQGPSWFLFLFWVAGIPVRGAQKSRLASYLFMNRAIRQSRSEAKLNEFHYNQDLLEKVLGLSHKDLKPTELKAGLLPPWLQEKLNKDYIVVHAGMGGSALNWPASHYIDLVKELVAGGRLVVFTGTESDLPYWQEIYSAFSLSSQKHTSKEGLEIQNGILNLVTQLNFQELLSVLSGARALIAPSTGVLHLAASLGTKCIGLYPPIVVQHPRRWGALGKQVTNLEPGVDCPERFHCRGEACSFYPCMNRIEVEQVLGELQNDSNGR